MAQQILDTVLAWCTNTGIKVLISLIILIVSFIIINAIFKKLAKKALKSKKLDTTLSKVLVYVGKIVCKALVIVALVGYLGIDTSGITALIASLGVAAGLAVNGTLSNFAGGVLLLITRPCKIDDFIEACGYSGTVTDIRITYTKLRTPDNKIIYVPNGALSTSSIINYSEEGLRRVDLNFDIDYANDYKKAEEIVARIISEHALTLSDPAPMVRISKHDASSIQLVARAWVNNADYWTVYFDLLEQVKSAFDAEGITIPFQQLDVHIKNN